MDSIDLDGEVVVTDRVQENSRRSVVKVETSGTESNADRSARPMGLKRKKEEDEVVRNIRNVSKAIPTLESEVS